MITPDMAAAFVLLCFGVLVLVCAGMLVGLMVQEYQEAQEERRNDRARAEESKRFRIPRV